MLLLKKNLDEFLSYFDSMGSLKQLEFYFKF